MPLGYPNSYLAFFPFFFGQRFFQINLELSNLHNTNITLLTKLKYIITMVDNGFFRNSKFQNSCKIEFEMCHKLEGVIACKHN
jgi:hypothetical protein